MTQTHPVHRLVTRSLSMESDSVLLTRYAKTGDEASFTELLKRHSAMVSQVAWRQGVMHDAVQDVAQATFWLLSRRAGRLQHHPNLVGWLHQAARRFSLKAVSAQRTRSKYESTVVPHGTVPPPDELLKRQELLDRIDRSIELLPTELRDLCILHYLEGLSQREIATRLQLPLGTVATRLNKGRILLQRRLLMTGASMASVTSLLDELQAELTRQATKLNWKTLSPATQQLTKTSALLKLTMMASLVILVMGMGVIVWWLTPGDQKPVQAIDSAFMSQLAPVSQDKDLQRDWQALQGHWVYVSVNPVTGKLDGSDILIIKDRKAVVRHQYIGSAVNIGRPAKDIYLSRSGIHTVLEIHEPFDTDGPSKLFVQGVVRWPSPEHMQLGVRKPSKDYKMALYDLAIKGRDNPVTTWEDPGLVTLDFRLISRETTNDLIARPQPLELLKFDKTGQQWLAETKIIAVAEEAFRATWQSTPKVSIDELETVFQTWKRIIKESGCIGSDRTPYARKLYQASLEVGDFLRREVEAQRMPSNVILRWSVQVMEAELIMKHLTPLDR